MATPQVPGKTRRGLTGDALAGLSLDRRRALVQALAVEHGHQVVSATPRGNDFDLVLSLQVLGVPQSILVRLTKGQHSEDAHVNAAADAVRAGCWTHYLVGSLGDPDALSTHVAYLPLGRLLAMIEDSALVHWTDDGPQADIEAYGAWRASSAEMVDSDPSGMRWLRTLSLNKLPADLKGSSIPAETWFEEAIFRVCVRLLGLQGRRLGARRPGTREPDGLFVCPGRDQVVLFDAKAARDGFEMSAAEERKLIEYATREWNWRGRQLSVSAVVVISSSFPTAKRAYAGRRKALQDAGSDLIYLTADALLALARSISNYKDDSTAAARIDWCDLLQRGVVTVEHATTAAKQAIALATADGTH